MRELFIIDKRNYIENGTIGRRPSVRGIVIKDGKVATVEVDMGAPIVKAQLVPAISPSGRDEIIDEDIKIQPKFTKKIKIKY